MPSVLSPASITARALEALARVRRAVPRALTSSFVLPFSTTYRLTDSAATEHLR
jgi:hypothetical protein